MLPGEMRFQGTIALSMRRVWPTQAAMANREPGVATSVGSKVAQSTTTKFLSARRPFSWIAQANPSLRFRTKGAELSPGNTLPGGVPAATKNLHIAPNGCRKSPLNGIIRTMLHKLLSQKKNLIEPKSSAGAAVALSAGLEIQARVKKLFHGSLAIRVVTAGSSNACEQELVALGNPFYDVERFGIHFVASPRHADMLLITGPVSRNMREPLLRTYEAMPAPKYFSDAKPIPCFELPPSVMRWMD